MNFPLILGPVLIAFGVATLLHVLVVSGTGRRREVGLLKSSASSAVRSPSPCRGRPPPALVGIVIGIPAGIALGRLVWRILANDLGVVPAPVVDIGIIARWP